MLERELLRERRDGDSVLEQPAEVGVVAGARARRAPPRGAQLAVAEQRSSSRTVAGVVDLPRKVLEEAVELVEVAVGDGQEALELALLGADHALDRLELELELLAEAHGAPAHRHEVAALEAGAEQVSAAEHARRQRAAAVAQLE